MLSKLFKSRRQQKPRWQHSNPEIRRTATQQLSDTDAEQRQILHTLVLTDTDAQVRTAALARISTPAALLSLLEESQRPLLGQLEQRLKALLPHQDAEPDRALTQQLLACTNQISVFNAVGDSPLGMAMLAQLDDQARARLALSNVAVPVRKQAALLIDNPAVIEQLLHASRQKDKTIQRIMRDKNKQRRQQEKQHQAQQQQAQDVGEQLRQLANSAWFPLYPAKLASLQHTLSALPETMIDNAVAQALTQCQQRVTQHQADEQQQQQTRQAEQQHAALLDYIAQLNQQPLDQPPEPKQLEHWHELPKQWAPLPPNQSEIFSQALTKLDQTLHQRQQRIQQQAQLASLLQQLTEPATEQAESNTHTGDSDDRPTLLDQARQLQQQISHWPDSQQPAHLLAQLHQTLDAEQHRLQHQQQHRQAQRKHQQQQVEQTLQALQLAIEHGQIQQAEQHQRELSQQSKPLNKAQRQRYNSLLQQLKSLQSWQGYAANEKKQALCQAMEALLEQPLPADQKASRIKQLQQQWKQLEQTDPQHSGDLWRRFKDAADQAWAPCEVYFRQQRELRQYNLEQRNLICQQVSDYLAQIDWQQDDWRGAEKVIQKAKSEWKRFTPVDRKPGHPLQQRFNQLILDTEARFKHFKQTALEQKQHMIDQAQHWADHDDPHYAAEQIKHLQQQWKQAGITFHSQEKKLWRAFRQRCDHVFAKRQHAKTALSQAQKPLQTLERITQQLQQFLATPRNVPEQLVRLEQAEQLLEQHPTLFTQGPGQRIGDTFERTRTQLEQQISAYNQLLDSPHTCRYEEQAALCEQFESAVFAGSEPPALTVSSWDDALQTRYQQALAANGDPGALKQQLHRSAEQQRHLCIRLEIALGLPSPESDQALRLAQQVERLQQGGLHTEPAMDLAGVKTLHLNWNSIPFARHNSALSKRFNELLAEVFGSP